MERLMAMDTAKEAALLEQVLDQAKDFLNSRGERFVAPQHPRQAPAPLAEELAFVYEGHIGTALRAYREADVRGALAQAKDLCGFAAQNDTYRALALLTKYERDREGFLSLLWQLDQVCSAVLRRPDYGQRQCGGLRPDAAAVILRAGAEARRAVAANGNLRLIVALLAARIA